MIKVVGFVKKRPDLTREQFKEYWLKNHSKLEKESAENNPVRRIVASFATGEKVGYIQKDPPWDGMVELCFASVEEMRAQLTGPQRGVMREDEKNFIDVSEEAVFVVTEEYVMAEKTPRETGV